MDEKSSSSAPDALAAKVRDRSDHLWGALLDQAVRAWKLVTRSDGSVAVAACMIPKGARVETGDSLDRVWYRATQIEVLECGRWDEDGATTRYVAEAPAEHYTLVGFPDRVIYYPGRVTQHPDGLWAYAAPWQTYWPYARHAARKILDAGAHGGLLEIELSECH